MVFRFGTKCTGDKNKNGQRLLDETNDSVIAENTISGQPISGD